MTTLLSREKWSSVEGLHQCAWFAVGMFVYGLTVYRLTEDPLIDSNQDVIVLVVDEEINFFASWTNWTAKYGINY